MERFALKLLERTRLLGLAYRLHARRLAFRAPKLTAPLDGAEPLPPPLLRVRTAGGAEPTWFVHGGRLAFESIREWAPVGEGGSVLDFGCGCGRVTRYWRGVGPRVVGTDIDADAVAWCRSNLTFARFERSRLAPPLVFDDDAFDFVYALSVFTHLPVDLQRAWLNELRRVLRPAGTLLLTTHGVRYRGRLSEEERARFDAGEIIVHWKRVAGSNLCAAYHPPGALSTLADGFHEVAFVAEGARGNPYQDLNVLSLSST